MDLVTIITCVSVAITLLSIGVAVFQILDSKKEFISLSRGRQSAINGKWTGTFRQDNLVNEKELVGTMMINLKTKGKLVKGFGEYGGKYGDQFSYRENILLKGGFKHDRFLVLDYYNKNDQKTHFGHYILELSSEGDQLKGKLIAYGNKSEAVIAADILLRKESVN